MSRRTSIAFGILAGLGLAACVDDGGDDADQVDQTQAAAVSTSRVWVAYAGQHKEDVKNAVRGANGRVHHEFDAIGAIVVSVPTPALNGLSRNPHVLEIEEDALRMPYAAVPGESPPYGVGMVGGLAMHAAGIKGAGVEVCIIDSGLRIVSNAPIAESQVTYADGNLPGNQDGSGHGTHVAGTVAGTPYTTGVAPAARLHIVRVFGDDGAWAYSSTLADAANKCVAHGSKIISMSLGGANRSKFEEKAFNNALAAGVLPIAAAGNDGNTRTSFPAGYASVMSVGALDSSKLLGAFSQRNRDVEIAAPGVQVWSSVPYNDIATATVGTNVYEGGMVEFAAEATGATGALVAGGLCDATNPAWAGKVVLCERGTVDFYTKVNNAQISGAVAAIISNNVSGGFTGTLGAGKTSTIPAISLSLEDGNTLRASSLGAATTVKAKHDTSVNGYDAWDGTSMATPHVSGVAALVWSACPSVATAAKVRDAINGSAQDLGAAGRDTSFGYGLARACQASKLLCGVPATACP